MKLRPMKLLIALLMSMTTPAAAKSKSGLSRQAGDTLLQSFSCDSVGDRTHEVMSNLGILKDAVTSINEDSKKCRELSHAISELPKIEDIMRSLENDSVSKEIREQEGLINEALAELHLIENLPPGQQDLYPSVNDIRIIISNARAKLYELRPKLAIADASISKQKYNDGINELNTLGNRVVAALGQDHGCFGQDAQLKRRAITGVLGISGFFLGEPLGVATNLAGRLLQQTFDMATAAKDPVKEAFEPAEDLTLVFGLGCAMENLSKQHCRILKERELIEATEGGTCEQCVVATSEGQALADFATDIKQIQAASAAREQLDEASETGGAQRKAVKRVLSEIQESRAQLLKLKKDAQRYGEKDLALMLPTGIFEAMDDTLEYVNPAASFIKYGPGEVTGVSLEDSVDRGYYRGGITLEESRQDILLFMYGDEVDRASEMKALQDAVLSSMTETERARMSQAKFSAGSVMKQGLLSDVKSPAVDRAKQKLTKPETIDEILVRLQTFEQKLRATIKGAGGEDSLRQWSTMFLGGDTSDMTRRSPYQSLKNIKTFIENLPPDFKNSDEHGKLLSNESEINRISSVLEKAEAVRAQASPDDQTLSSLQEDFVGLVGNDLEFFQRMDALGKRLDRYQALSLQSKLDKATDPNEMRGLMYALHQEVMKDALTVSESDSMVGRKDKLNNARAVSAAGIEAFGTAFKDYIGRAFDFFDKAKKNPGLKDDVDPSIKSTLCMQLLGLSDLKPLKDFCDGAKKTAPGVTPLDWNEAAKLSRDQRVCLHEQFQKRVKNRETIKRAK